MHLMYPLVRTHTFFAILGTLLLLLPACDSGGSSEEEDDVNNEFSLTISPVPSSTASRAVPKQTHADSLEGWSFFYDTEGQHSETSPTGELFMIYFNNTQAFEDGEAVKEGLFGVATRYSNRPSTGTYAIGESGNEAVEEGEAFTFFISEDFGAVESQAFPFTLYRVHDGTLELTHSTDHRLKGSFEAQAQSITLDSTGTLTRDTVSVTGPFTAEDVETFVNTSPRF